MSFSSPIFKLAATFGLLAQVILAPARATTTVVDGLRPSSANQTQIQVQPAEVSLDIGAEGTKLTLTLNGQPIPQDSDVKLSDGGDGSDVLDFDKSTFVLKPKSTLKRLAFETTRKVTLQDAQSHKSNEITVKIKPNLKSLTLRAGEQAIAADAPLVLMNNQDQLISLSATDLSGTPLTQNQLSQFSLKPREENNVAISTSGMTLKPKDVMQDTETVIDVMLTGQAFPVSSLTVRALAKANAIEFLDLPGNRLQEGDSLNFQLVLRSQSGIPLAIIKDKREVTHSEDEQSLVEVVSTGDRFRIKALLWPKDNNQPPSKPVTITFTLVQNGVPLRKELKLEITRKDGSITFSPPIVEPLLPNGKVITIAQVRDGRNELTGGGVVRFELENPDDQKWVTLAPEGNQLTVYWRDPTPAELEASDGKGNIKQLQRPAQAVVKAITYLTNQPIVSKLSIHMAEVTQFAPLKIKLNVMDEDMASHLYGKVTSKENYVLTVRLYNNLRDDKNIGGENKHSSILAYSASVEISVGLEKRFNPKLKSELPVVWDKNQARELANARAQKIHEGSKTQAEADLKELEELQKKIEKALRELRETEDKADAAEREAENLRFEQLTNQSPELAGKIKAAETQARATRQRANQAMDRLNNLKTDLLRDGDTRAALYQLLAEKSVPNVPVDDGKWRPVRRDDLFRLSNTFQVIAPPPRRTLTASTNDTEPFCAGVLTYRPYTFEMVVNTVERREERSTRSRVFKVLSGFGTAASLATTVPGFRTAASMAGEGGNSALANFQIFLDKYTNLLLPAADRLFPDLSETHRQNIVSQAMKPIEEIPFGSDISRVLFIPKREIHGLLRGHDVRISEICPFFFSIEVAVVQKGGVVQQGARPQ